MLDAARTRAAARGVDVTLRHGRADTLPFEDAAFDAVIAVTVLCFVPDATARFANWLACSRRAVASFGELGRYSVWAAERRVRGWLGATTWRRARFWSRAELERLSRNAGLGVVGVRGSIFFPPSSLAARVVAPLEPLLTRLHCPGAAFLALAADKLQRDGRGGPGSSRRQRERART